MISGNGKENELDLPKSDPFASKLNLQSFLLASTILQANAKGKGKSWKTLPLLQRRHNTGSKEKTSFTDVRPVSNLPPAFKQSLKNVTAGPKMGSIW